jgi:hypothetical protein
MSGENMGFLVTRGIAALWTVALVSYPSRPAEAKPVLAPFASTIATMAEIIRAVVASRTVIMKVMLEVLFAAMLA